MSSADGEELPDGHRLDVGLVLQLDRLMGPSAPAPESWWDLWIHCQNHLAHTNWSPSGCQRKEAFTDVGLEFKGRDRESLMVAGA